MTFVNINHTFKTSPRTLHSVKNWIFYNNIRKISNFSEHFTISFISQPVLTGFFMIFGLLEMGTLGLQIHQFRPVLTAKTGSLRPVFLQSLILKIQKTRLLVWSFSGLVWSSCCIFPVLGLNLHTLDQLLCAMWNFPAYKLKSTN